MSIFSSATFNSMKTNLKNLDHKKTLFLIDIEGYEFHLFNEKFCDYFSNSFFIIEDHNFNISNNKILSNFYKIIYKHFNVEFISDKSKNPFETNILKNFSDDEKYLMMSEGRPELMRWIVMLPKV